MKLVAGNWKMNGSVASESVLIELIQGLSGKSALPEILVCPPATLLHQFSNRVRTTQIKLGGQCCHPNPSGANTGDISAEMLRDAGAQYVIVGHSERRTNHAETSLEVAKQAIAAFRAKIIPIICIGENEAAYEKGETKTVLAAQISESVPKLESTHTLTLAYEPIWAIGTGRTPTVGEIIDTHRFIRKSVDQKVGSLVGGLRILYGGSVKPSNAAEILNAEGVDGVLVGGASLKATDFLAIIAGCIA